MAMPLTAPSKTNAERQQAASLDLFLVTDVRPSSHETGRTRAISQTVKIAPFNSFTFQRRLH
jgi:hypothetical protein